MVEDARSRRRLVMFSAAIGLPVLWAAVEILRGGSPSHALLEVPAWSSADPPPTGPGIVKLEDGILLKPAPGIANPRMWSAEEANLPDAAEVIGVSVGVAHRAYRIEALSGLPERHVVNDVVAGRALSVTYCDIARCARAFVGGESDVPPDISVVGLEVARSRLVLQVDGKRYVQETGEPFDADGSAEPLGHERHPVVVTTWGEWRAAHPGSLVYLGAESRPGS